MSATRRRSRRPRSFIHHTVADSLAPGAEAAVTRARHRPGSAYCAHDHDFFEAFWIEAGTAVHVLGEVREELAAGTVVFIRPHDQHAFTTTRDGEFTLVNAVFAPQAVARIRATYAGDVAQWPWPEAGHPVHRQLDRSGLAEVQAWVDAVRRSPSRLTVDGLLLTLLERSSPMAAADDGIPPWLRQAVLDFTSPDHLADGVDGLARLAARGKAHLNRSVRRHYQTTATGLVNRSIASINAPADPWTRDPLNLLLHHERHHPPSQRTPAERHLVHGRPDAR